MSIEDRKCLNREEVAFLKTISIVLMLIHHLISFPDKILSENAPVFLTEMGETVRKLG
mgnify:FL=1